MKTARKLDRIDLRILEILQDNAQTRFSDMAAELNVSNGTIHVRTKKLKELGIIKKSTIQLDLNELDYSIQAFIGISIDAKQNLENIVKALKEIPQVMSCSSTTGSHSIMLTLATKDPRQLQQILTERIHHIEGVSKTETFITLEEHFIKPLELLAQ